MIERRDLFDTANRAFELEANPFGEFPLPAALGLVRQHIEPARDVGRCGNRFLRIAEDIAVQDAENGGLLNDLSIVAAVQSAQHVANDSRFVDDRRRSVPASSSPE